MIRLTNKLIKITKKHNFTTIIDGENFRFVPKTKKIDFLYRAVDNGYVAIVGKSHNYTEYYKQYPFYKHLNYFLINGNNIKCQDDTFCIYFANLLENNESDYMLYSNDKFIDWENITTQKSCFVKNTYNYPFNPLEYNYSKKIMKSDFSHLC